MSSFVHDIVSNLLFTLPLLGRDILIFVFSYAEGLPVIGSLLPGGTVALLIGTLTNEGFMHPLVAVNIIAAGSFLGDMTGFFLGGQLRKIPYIARMLAHEKHQAKWDIFDRHIALIIIFGKLIPVVRSTPSLFAGARSLPTWKYIFYVIIGSYLWAFAGIYAGNYLSQLLGDNAVTILLIVLVATGVIAWSSNRALRWHKNRKRVE